MCQRRSLALFATASRTCAKKIRSRMKVMSDNPFLRQRHRDARYPSRTESIVGLLYEEEGTYREMLKEPRPEDVRRNLRKDTPLLLVLLARRVIVFLARTLTTTDTRVTRVTCNSKKRAKVITCRLGNQYEFMVISERFLLIYFTQFIYFTQRKNILIYWNIQIALSKIFISNNMYTH